MSLLSGTSIVHQTGQPPAAPRLATDVAALKDASRRANARWPRKNEAILDRGDVRCLGMVRPGRENGTPAEPENVDCDGRLANAAATGTAEVCLVAWRGESTACGDLSVGGRIGECVIFVSQGWGSVHNAAGDFTRRRHGHNSEALEKVHQLIRRPITRVRGLDRLQSGESTLLH
jgi:hypothetical protein